MEATGKRRAGARPKASTAGADGRVRADHDGDDAPVRVPRAVVRRRPSELACAWCGGVVRVKSAGRVPTWCSAGCRHRAWEQNRAAASGRCAVLVVERIVEVEPAVGTVTTSSMAVIPRAAGWVEMIAALTKQLDTGRLYDRDLAAVGPPSLS